MSKWHRLIELNIHWNWVIYRFNNIFKHLIWAQRLNEIVNQIKINGIVGNGIMRHKKGNDEPNEQLNQNFQHWNQFVWQFSLTPCIVHAGHGIVIVTWKVRWMGIHYYYVVVLFCSLNIQLLSVCSIISGKNLSGNKKLCVLLLFKMWAIGIALES